MLAKDIDDCSNCPLRENDCTGGWTTGVGSMSVEPPCASWDDKTEVYEGMYDD